MQQVSRDVQQLLQLLGGLELGLLALGVLVLLKQGQERLLEGWAGTLRVNTVDLSALGVGFCGMMQWRGDGQAWYGDNVLRLAVAMKQPGSDTSCVVQAHHG